MTYTGGAEDSLGSVPVGRKKRVFNLVKDEKNVESCWFEVRGLQEAYLQVWKEKAHAEERGKHSCLHPE